MESNRPMTPMGAGMGNKVSRRRWSAVDTVVVLLALIAVAGIVYRVVYTARQRNAAATRTMYVVSFEVDAIHQDVLDEVKGFDAVYFCENDICLGYIGVYEDTTTGSYRVAVERDENPVLDNEGNHIPDFVSATGEMVCTDGVLSSGGGSLLVGTSGLYLTPGSRVQVRTDRAIMDLRITKIAVHA